MHAWLRQSNQPQLSGWLCHTTASGLHQQSPALMTSLYSASYQSGEPRRPFLALPRNCKRLPAAAGHSMQHAAMPCNFMPPCRLPVMSGSQTSRQLKLTILAAPGTKAYSLSAITEAALASRLCHCTLCWRLGRHMSERAPG